MHVLNSINEHKNSFDSEQSKEADSFKRPHKKMVYETTARHITLISNNLIIKWTKEKKKKFEYSRKKNCWDCRTSSCGYCVGWSTFCNQIVQESSPFSARHLTVSWRTGRNFFVGLLKTINNIRQCQSKKINGQITMSSYMNHI